MVDLIEESFRRLFPDRRFSYLTEEKYSLRLKDFNANILLRGGKITVKYNLQWKNIDDEIKIGLIQTLLLKLFKVRDKTSVSYLNIDLYNDFLKRIPDFAEVHKSHPELEDSFHRVNSELLDGELEKPNLVWGKASTRKLACYNFHNNTVTVSTVFKESPKHVLDFLMYHELLHKKFQFSHKNGRASYHSSAFRAAERQFPGYPAVEKDIETEIRRHKRGQRTKDLSRGGSGRKKKGLLSWFK